MEHSPTESEQDLIAELVEELGADYASIRLTPTMLDKSIIDAHEAVQLLLKRAGVVDYADMQRGARDGGVRVPAYLLSGAEKRRAEISFYRPQTKQGDPRLWPFGLGKLAVAGELLLLFSTSAGLIAAVVSTTRGVSAHAASLLAQEIGLPTRSLKRAAILLREKFQGIQQRGWIEAVGHGPRAVGETFEYAMGLTTNSYSRPDFMGEIEIKAARVTKSKTRTKLQTLVSLAPKWSGALRSTRDLVATHGYWDKKRDRFALYCSIFSSPNPLGWSLLVDVAADTIAVQKHKQTVLLFSVSELSTALERKHPATIFVSARSRRTAGTEAFQYFAARYCESLSAPRYIEELLCVNACIDLTANI